MNIFEKIKSKNIERLEKIRKIKEQQKIKKILKNKKATIIKNLKEQATEFFGLLKDPRYKYYQNFIKELSNIMNEKLKEINLNPKLSSDQRALLSAQLSAQIEIINYLIEYPLQIIEEYEKIKEIKKNT